MLATFLSGAEFEIQKGVPFLAGKAVEAGRFYAPRHCATRNFNKRPDYGMKMAKPTVDKVGHELIDRLLTVIRPNCKKKNDRPDLDGSGIDVHAMIGKLPKPKKGWTLPGHNYTDTYNPLEKQLVYDPETGNITPIYQPPAPPRGGNRCNCHATRCRLWRLQLPRKKNVRIGYRFGK